MRVLVISDVHGNMSALEAVLRDAGTVDAVWSLGDLVGYGPDPNDCVECVRSLPNIICLLGNHDAAALDIIPLEAFNREARSSIRWLKSVLKDENFQFLLDLPEKVIIDEVTLVHGSPRDPVWEYILDTNIARDNFKHFSTHNCFVGHSHLPIAYFESNNNGKVDWKMFIDDAPIKITERAILNPGSVGQPRDHNAQAAYAIYLPDENIWEAHRVEYDITGVQRRIYAAGLPNRHAERLSEGW